MRCEVGGSVTSDESSAGSGKGASIGRKVSDSLTLQTPLALTAKSAEDKGAVQACVEAQLDRGGARPRAGAGRAGSRILPSLLCKYSKMSVSDHCNLLT